MHHCIWDEINRVLEPQYCLHSASDINRAERCQRRTSPQDALKHQLANAAEGLTFKTRAQQLARDKQEQAQEAALASIEQRLAALAAEIREEYEAYQKMLADPRVIVNSEWLMNHIRDLIIQADEEARNTTLAEMCKLM